MIRRLLVLVTAAVLVLPLAGSGGPENARLEGQWFTVAPGLGSMCPTDRGVRFARILTSADHVSFHGCNADLELNGEPLATLTQCRRINILR